MPKTYLGDSVYATFDGFSIILTTENGGEPSNTIIMEPQVCNALERFVDQLPLLEAKDAGEDA